MYTQDQDRDGTNRPPKPFLMLFYFFYYFFPILNVPIF